MLTKRTKYVIEQFVQKEAISQKDAWNLVKCERLPDLERTLYKIFSLHDRDIDKMKHYLWDVIFDTVEDTFDKCEIMVMRSIFNNKGIVSRYKMRNMFSRYLLGRALQCLIERDIIFEIAMKNNSMLYCLTPLFINDARNHGRTTKK